METEGATSATATAASPPRAAAEQRLLPPDAVVRALPASDDARATTLAAREGVRAVLHGRDAHRRVVIVGPCSVHDPEGALDYARRLARVAARVSPDLLVLMRVFVEKPRTHVGWKGLVNDPTRDGRCDVGLGLATARQLMLRVLDLGLPIATELLEPFTAPYLRDLVSWGGIGARTQQSPVHRQLASESPHPVGLKNGTDGDVESAVHAMRAAREPQSFPALGGDGSCVVRRSPGNPDVHLVLRGGRSGTNHDEASIARAARRVEAAIPDAPRRPVLVDCSHGNAHGDPRAQADACRAVQESLARGARGLLGVMLESYLETGRQDATPGAPLRYGVSITDPCLGWDETEALLEGLAAAVGGSPGDASSARNELR